MLAQHLPRNFFFGVVEKFVTFFFPRFVLIASGTEIFWRVSLKFELVLATSRFHCHRSKRHAIYEVTRKWHLSTTALRLSTRNVGNPPPIRPPCFPPPPLFRLLPLLPFTAVLPPRSSKLSDYTACKLKLKHIRTCWCEYPKPQNAYHRMIASQLGCSLFLVLLFSGIIQHTQNKNADDF